MSASKIVDDEDGTVWCGVVVDQIENVDKQKKKAQEIPNTQKRDKDKEATVQTSDTKHRFYREYFESNIFAQLVQLFGTKFYATLTICLNISDPNKNKSGFRCQKAVVKDTVIKTNYRHQMEYSGGKYVRLPVEVQLLREESAAKEMLARMSAQKKKVKAAAGQAATTTTTNGKRNQCAAQTSTSTATLKL